MTDGQRRRLSKLLYQRALREVDAGKMDEVKKAIDLVQLLDPKDALRDFLDGLAGDGHDD